MQPAAGLLVLTVAFAACIAPAGVSAQHGASADAPGFRLGEQPVTYAEMERYLAALAGASERARVSVYGHTPLDRKLYALAISSPSNLGRLKETQAGLASVAQRPHGDAVAASLLRTLPAVVWMGYGIHADELGASDAGLRLIEHLLAGQDATTLKILDNLIVYVDPMANPDGRERTLTHLAAFQRNVAVLDSQDILHHEFWPPSRFNHYLMDLNRDALFLTQSESVARLSAILDAQPQVLIDAHEMRYHSTHLWALPAEPLNPHLPRPVHAAWQRFGADLARSFDADGKSYYTRSWNEVFYPGYYDILPAYSGITPILFEQGRTSGVSVTLPNGRVRRFADAVDDLLQSSLVALASAADHRQQVLDDWWRARTEGARGVTGRGPQAWLVPPADAYKIGRLEHILRAHRIDFQRLANPARASGLYSTWSAQAQAQALPAGTILVRAAQPTAGLIRNLFDYHVAMDEQFLRTERRNLELSRNTQIYDITAWSLPHAFALDAYWTDRVPAGEWHADDPTADRRVATPQPARYGYLYEDPSLFATARLLQRGIKIRVATESFERSGRAYPGGTLLIRNDDQSGAAAEELRGALAEESARSGVEFQDLDGARIHVGPDLGDDKFVLLTQPRIAVLLGASLQATSVGALWHLFDKSMGVPATLLDIARLATLDLSRYNVLVLPEAESFRRTVAVLAGGGTTALKRWIESGGTLIAIGSAVSAASELGLTAVVPRAAAVDRTPPLMLGRPAAATIAADHLSASGALAATNSVAATLGFDSAPVIGEGARALLGPPRWAYVFPQVLPSFAQWADGVPEPQRLQTALPALLERYLPRGAYLAVELKPLHWLGYGAAPRIPALFRERDALLADAALEIAGRYAEPRRLVLAGLVWPEAVGYIAGTSYLTRERLARGQLIAFANDPVYRGYSLGTQRLLLNAVILGPGLVAQ